MLRSALLCALLLAPAGAFQVFAPQEQVLAVHGQPTVLRCNYTPSPTSDLQSLIVTWQRKSNNAVVHSFYYGTNQLSTQDEAYRGRASLFTDELLKGNAALRLDNVTVMDEGIYQCSVSNSDGTGKVEMHVMFAAFYTEPRLTIQMEHSKVTLRYESEGYPAPEVHWVDPEGQNLLYSTNVFQPNGGSKLFSLQSDLVLEPQQKVNYTFTLKNSLLGQVIERPVIFSCDIGDVKNLNWILICFGFTIVFLLCFVIIFVITRRKR
ncbi:CD276 antigen-like [Arapaima gigas]